MREPKVIPQPHHPGRWIIVDADGNSDGWSYPTREAAEEARTALRFGEPAKTDIDGTPCA